MPQEEIPTPLTRTHWFQSQSLVEGLRMALAHPAFQAARTLLLQLETAERTHGRSGSPKPDVLLARDLCYLDGYTAAFDQLTKLTSHAPRGPQAEPMEEWGHIKPTGYGAVTLAGEPPQSLES